MYSRPSEALRSARQSRSVLRIHGCHSRPDGTNQLDSPNGAAQVKLALRLNEGGCFPAQNPDMDVRGLLPQNRRKHPLNAPDFDLQNIMHGGALGAADGERLLALGSNCQLYEPRL